MSDFAVQRKNMVESQVRPSDVTDRRIIRAMAAMPRERFVPPVMQSIAYGDGAIRIAEARPGQPTRYLLSPRSTAALMQMLELDAQQRVLVVGAGTGYSAALIAQIARHVVAVEADAALAGLAAEAIAATVPASRVSVVTAPLAGGHPADAPYDSILLEGAVADIPAALLDQLKDGGRLVAIRKENGVGRATVWRRHGSTFASRAVRDMDAGVLPGFEPRPSFVF